MVKASGPHNTEESIMVKASGPHNTEGSVMVTQSLENTKNPATAGPIFIIGQIPQFKFPQKGKAEYNFYRYKSPAGTPRRNNESRYRASATSVDEAGYLTPPTPLLQHSACTYDLQ